VHIEGSEAKMSATLCTENKLRGGYYTSSYVADWLSRWAIRTSEDRVLEPSCGDGAFVESAARRLLNMGADPADVSAQLCAVELIESEAAKASARLSTLLGVGSGNSVHCADFFHWFSQGNGAYFHCVLGNPPFIRYQNFPESSRSLAMRLLHEAGLKPNKLTNIWVPFVVGAVNLLTQGGRLAMVLPAELLQVSYAAQLRSFLVDSFARMDIFACNETFFDGAQQEVVLLLAEGKTACRSTVNKCRIDLVETRSLSELLQRTADTRTPTRTVKVVQHDSEKWLKYFLLPREIAFMRKLRSSAQVADFSRYAAVDIGIVTGQNSFFVLDKTRVESLSLAGETRPLVGRSSQLKGVVLTEADLRELSESRQNVFLFYVEDNLYHRLSPSARSYIALGEKEKIHAGFKCSVRKPWYTVPSVWVPDCFLFRQIYDFPRLIVNETSAVSTDTIHRVRCNCDRRLLSRTFYTHLTAASSEIEGRSYGGGVLELEPTEAERVLIPGVLSEKALPLAEIDCLVRQGKLSEVLRINDALVLRDTVGLSTRECKTLENIWTKMRDRRMSRRKLPR
jgi:adenine-specific DNA-methyltransferase